MEKPVSLREFIDEMQTANAEVQSYLNRVTGEFGIVTIENASIVEDESDWSDYNDWQQKMLEETDTILSAPEIWLKLPSQWDIHEYAIMQDFCGTIEEERLADTLFRAIRGSGAFRRFKDTVYRHHLEDHWFSFRLQAFKEIAIDWLEENELAFQDDIPA